MLVLAEKLVVLGVRMASYRTQVCRIFNRHNFTEVTVTVVLELTICLFAMGFQE